MRLVLSLRTRDHIDLVEAHVAFHLAAGVDTIIATDHRSVDGTREVLEGFERDGSVVLIRNDAETYAPGMLLNDAVRIATTELGADWIIHSDADEFWWPRGGDLKQVLAAIPSRFGVVRGFWRHFAPRPEDGSYFAERMTARLAARGPWMDVEHTFHPHVKIAQRADHAIVVKRGSHDVVTDSPILRSWYPFELLHFPLRTRRQAHEKYEAWRPVLDRGVSVASHVDSAVDAIRADAFDDFYGRYVVDDARLAEGLDEGWLAVDTRLRDALRALAGSPHDPLGDTFASRDDGGGRIDFPAFDLAGQAAHADDAMALADPMERLGRRLDRFEERLDALR